EHNKRVKRSFEFGSLAHQWMFGIADADDVRRYDSSINKMEKNQDKILRIVHDQISILSSTIYNFNDTVTLQRMISNAQMNKVDLFVMTPYELLSEIKNIENILPDDLKLPVKFNLENIHENFNLFYILPIYVPINEYGQFLHMTESPMYLLADEMVTKYFVWPNLNNCIVVAKIFVCAFNEMIHNGEFDPICVTQLLKNSAVTLLPQRETYYRVQKRNGVSVLF
ncbi:hypothetical protein AGLY_017427, partial [Aphis glycines]